MGGAPTVALSKELKLYSPAAFGAQLPFKLEQPKVAGTGRNSPFIGVVYEGGKWKVTRGYPNRAEWPVFPTGAAAARHSERRAGAQGGQEPGKGL